MTPDDKKLEEIEQGLICNLCEGEGKIWSEGHQAPSEVCENCSGKGLTICGDDIEWLIAQVRKLEGQVQKLEEKKGSLIADLMGCRDGALVRDLKVRVKELEGATDDAFRRGWQAGNDAQEELERQILDERARRMEAEHAYDRLFHGVSSHGADRNQKCVACAWTPERWREEAGKDKE